MTKPRLVIGNRNYSSWSLRPWLALRAADVDIDVEMIPLQQPDTKERLLATSPSGLVPVLHMDGEVIWDSLAICEAVADMKPDAGLWPTDPAARRRARAVSAEMHSGFLPLRMHMPMNIRASHPGAGMGEGVAEDVARIDEIWRVCRDDFGRGGPYLFGGFTIADCMYAPVVFRFATYRPHMSSIAAGYVEAMLANPWMMEWRDAAHAESERIASHDERY